MQKIRKVLIPVAVLLCSSASAVNYTFRQGHGLEYSWQTDDRVGITSGIVSYGKMDQLSFWASSKAGTSQNERSLYSVGYQLKTEMQYYSYSPYQWSADFDAHNIRCRFDQQTQNGNGSTSGLASCDYQMASATTSSTDCSFAYQHIGGILRISFPAPATMVMTGLSISTDSPALATTAVMDIIEQKVIPDGYSSELTLQTENLSVKKGEEVVLYVACPAQNLSSMLLTISVNDDASGYLLGSLLGPNVKAGRLYEISLGASSRAATRTLQNVQQDYLQNVQETNIQRIAGISNPLAHAEDFLIDNDYNPVVAVASPMADKRKNDDYYTLDGMRTASPRKGKVYIHKGKKIVRQN